MTTVILFLFFNDYICIIPPPYRDARNYGENESIESDHLFIYFLLWDNNVDKQFPELLLLRKEVYP